MSSDSILSWDEVQRMALPANATMLIPPTPDPAELEAITSGAPEQRPHWLEDEFQTAPKSQQVIDPDANRAAAERAEYGHPAVRLLANLVAVNAVLEYAQTPAKKDEEEQPIPPKVEPDPK